MTWFIVYANGHPFGVFADTLDQATTLAAVHLASIAGVRTLERPTELARLDVPRT